MPTKLLLAALLVSSYVQSEFSADIDEFAKLFAALHGHGDDVLQTLNVVAEKSGELFKLGSSVGALIAAGLDNTFEVDSDEERARRKLHNAMNQQFEDTTGPRIHLEKSRMYESRVVIDYKSEVSVKLVGLRRHFLWVTDPDIAVRHGFKDRFMRHCKIAAEPQSILNYLDRIFRLDCPLPTKDQICLFVRAQRAFRHIESRFEERDGFDYGRYADAKSTILAHITALSKGEAETLISRLENFYTPPREELEKQLRRGLIHGLSEEVQKLASETVLKGPIMNSCILEAVNNAYEYTSANLLERVRTMTADLLHTELMTIACTNASMGGDVNAMGQILKETKEKVEAIGKHVVSWVRSAQSLSWPEVSIEAAKSELGSAKIPIASFNETASRIRKAFEERGSERHSYQVLITDSKVMDKYWSVRTQRDGLYANFTNYGGIDCHIFRYDTVKSDRAKNASEWFEEKRDTIWTGLKDGMDSRFTSGVLAVLDERHSLIQGELYRSAILLRNRKFLSKNARINIGQAFGAIMGTNATSVVDFFENDFFAYAWKLYLFL